MVLSRGLGKLLGCPQWLRSACRQLSVAVPLAINLFSLTALAYASPPDPSWIPGIYDGADYDDVVVMLTDLGKGCQHSTPLVKITARPVLSHTIRFVDLWAPTVPASLARQFRSPPVVAPTVPASLARQFRSPPVV
jgi:hypothetical protein